MSRPATRSSEPLPHARSFAELSAGTCHYSVDGPLSGPTLLLIHGATVPAWQFDNLAPLLNGAGIRTVRLDLYGHGYSARPAVAHDYPLFTSQVCQLLDHLQLAGDIHLLGHSLGSAIGARLLRANPDRFRSLVMTAPMLSFDRGRVVKHLLRLPLLGDWLMYSCVVPLLLQRRTRRYRNIQGGRFVQLFRDQLRVPGFGRSLLSLVRSDVLADQRQSYGDIAELANPVLLLSGAGDHIATPAHMRILEELLPCAESRVIGGAAHALVLTHPQQVASHIIRFMGVIGRDINSTRKLI